MKKLYILIISIILLTPITVYATSNHCENESFTRRKKEHKDCVRPTTIPTYVPTPTTTPTVTPEPTVAPTPLPTQAPTPTPQVLSETVETFQGK